MNINVGDIWKYIAPPGNEDSRVIVNRIDYVAEGKRLIHISILNGIFVNGLI
jgi:hypothetical protein